MNNRKKTITIFGGTGFLGRHIVKKLADYGFIVKIATRIPESAYKLKPYGEVGQIVAVKCNYSDPHSIRSVIKGSDFVINSIGILFEKKRNSFTKIHIDLAAMIAKACSDENVKKFIHISSLGCDTSNSKYAKSKFEGEKAVLSNYPNATILRPSIIFGKEDNFFNMFAELIRFTPILPLIGGGKTKFQPIYVEDIAEVTIKIINSDNKRYSGKIYQIGGNDIVTFKEIYEKIFKYTNRRRKLIYVPFGIAKIIAWFLSIFPKPILTPDQVESLKNDNIVTDKTLNITAYNVKPKSMDIVLPQYLNNYRAGGKFANKSN